MPEFVNDIWMYVIGFFYDYESFIGSLIGIVISFLLWILTRPKKWKSLKTIVSAGVFLLTVALLFFSQRIKNNYTRVPNINLGEVPLVIVQFQLSNADLCYSDDPDYLSYDLDAQRHIQGLQEVDPYNNIFKVIKISPERNTLVKKSSLVKIVLTWGDKQDSKSAEEDNRPIYSLQQIGEDILDNQIVFNSIAITDTDYAWYKEKFGKELQEGIVTHEKNYVGAREDTGINAGVDNIWAGNDITVEDGKTYSVRLYVHNDNPNEENAVAEQTKVYFNIPTESSRQHKINGYISSANAVPANYIDYVNFNANQPFHLEYIWGSALIESNGKVGGTTLSDNIVEPLSGGVLIGYDSLDGKIPGGYLYDSYITIKVKVVYDKEFMIENWVRRVGDPDTSWKAATEAQVGDRVEIRMHYKNISKERLPHVAIRNILPPSMKYIEGSTILYNDMYPQGVHVAEDTVIENGVNIGGYTADENAYVYITVEITGENLAEGDNLLVDWARAQTGSVEDIVLQDYAKVFVHYEK